MCSLARALRPLSHGAGILRSGVQLLRISGGGCPIARGNVCVRVLAEGTVQGTHALEGPDRGDVSFFDVALGGLGGLLQSLREINVNLRVKDVAQDLLASIRRSIEEL